MEYTVQAILGFLDHCVSIEYIREYLNHWDYSSNNHTQLYNAQNLAFWFMVDYHLFQEVL
jgi:hypothetical protein